MSDPLLSPRPHTEEKRFEPKQKVELQEPKDDLFTYEQLAECDGKASSRKSDRLGRKADKQINTNWHQPGSNPDKPVLVAVKGTVYDVTRNSAYGQGGQYHGMHPPNCT